ncbi:hypothetical protein WUBG_17686 [Wuchereria bancrofti]|nr:hypothetical protein WUBG_17686 [Wuchereria bancrofti]
MSERYETGSIYFNSDSKAEKRPGPTFPSGLSAKSSNCKSENCKSACRRSLVVGDLLDR